eukprot:gene26147-34759_t
MKVFGQDLSVIRNQVHALVLNLYSWFITILSVAGFDFSGVVEITSCPDFKVGEEIFGFTMFGAYSSRLVVPSSQIRRVPKLTKIGRSLPMEQAAGIPAVAATALHAISLAGGWPNEVVTSNKAVLVHSAAGGVGSMLLQMLKVCGFHPIVAVIGNRRKKKFCLQVGADFVIVKGGGGNDNEDDESDTNSTRSESTPLRRSSVIWSEAERISPNGYVAIFDANGLETLSGSYEHLSRCGRLITYGFHSNLPRQTGALSPIEWVKMVIGLVQMPRFDPMAMVLESKAVAGFNLSFFADEHELIERYMKQIIAWIEGGDISVEGGLTIFDLEDIQAAHEYIQSGKSTGKIVVRTSKH